MKKSEIYKLALKESMRALIEINATADDIYEVARTLWCNIDLELYAESKAGSMGGGTDDELGF